MSIQTRVRDAIVPRDASREMAMPIDGRSDAQSRAPDVFVLFGSYTDGGVRAHERIVYRSVYSCKQYGFKE